MENGWKAMRFDIIKMKVNSNKKQNQMGNVIAVLNDLEATAQNFRSQSMATFCIS